MRLRQPQDRTFLWVVDYIRIFDPDTTDAKSKLDLLLEEEQMLYEVPIIGGWRFFEALLMDSW